jgi:predicted HD superfamily hydrolase involved in NAD metabolism
MGGDMLTDFKNWRYPERILSACTIAVFDRENFFTDYEREKALFKQRFNSEFVKLSYLGGKASSTKMRIYSQFGLKIPFAPDGVSEYIENTNLYSPDKYQQFIIKNLPEKRVKHTADVVISALKRAKELGLDVQKVITAATLHDCAKYIDYKTVDGFILPEDVPNPVVHAFLGAYVAQNVLGIDDEEIIDTIRYHTSGKANMSTLSKLIFVADMVEEGRVYDGVEELRELYEKADFEKCFVECLKEEFLHLINKQQKIYHETINAFNYYVEDDK